MKTNKNYLLKLLPVSAALILNFSCKKDKPEPAAPPVVVPQPAGQNVFIINEGNFGQGNGSVSLYDPVAKAVDADRFGSQNNGAKLGDTPQSMLLHGSSYFIVVNNSGKIVQCDLSLKKQKEMTGFTSPRFILPFSGDKAYVSDIADKSLKVLNLASGAVEKTIPMTASTERLLVVNGKLYASSLSSEYLYIVDIVAQQLSDSINVGPGAGSLQLDKESNLWVLASGNYVDKGGRLSKIRLTDNTVVKTLTFTASQNPSRLSLSLTKDSLFYLLNGVNAVKVAAPELPAAPFISSGHANFYALGVNPRNGNVYVSDAIDFAQPSSVLIYSAKGDSLSHFKAGINATDFLFN
jgi:hypothetical protein